MYQLASQKGGFRMTPVVILEVATKVGTTITLQSGLAVVATVPRVREDM
jgi:hypothetical protein